MDRKSRAMKNFRWKLWVPCVVAAGAALVACSLLVPVQDQQCTTTPDCVARGPEFANAVCEDHVCVAGGGHDASTVDPVWGCVGQPGEVTNQAVTVTLKLQFFDAVDAVQTAGELGDDGGTDFLAVSYTGVRGLEVHACNGADPGCTSPIYATNKTDDAGETTIQLPQTFSGFVAYDEDAEVPSRVYMGNLLPDASSGNALIAALSEQELSLLASSLGVNVIDSGVGNVFFEVFDCQDRHSANVSFHPRNFVPNAGSVQWYAQSNEIPSNTVNATSSLGTGGIVNVPIGQLVVDAILVDDAGTYGATVGTASVIVAPGQATYAWIRVRTH